MAPNQTILLVVVLFLCLVNLTSFAVQDNEPELVNPENYKFHLKRYNQCVSSIMLPLRRELLTNCSDSNGIVDQLCLENRISNRPNTVLLARERCKHLFPTMEDTTNNFAHIEISSNHGVRRL